MVMGATEALFYSQTVPQVVTLKMLREKQADNHTIFVMTLSFADKICSLCLRQEVIGSSTRAQEGGGGLFINTPSLWSDDIKVGMAQNSLQSIVLQPDSGTSTTPLSLFVMLHFLH